MAARRAGIAPVLAIIVVDALSFGIVVPVIPTLVQQLLGHPSAAASLWLGALLAAFSVMQFLCAPVLGGLSDRFGRRPVLLLSLAGMGLNYLLLTWAPSLGWLFLGRVVAGATAASYSAAAAYVADVTPPERRAQRFGLVGAMFGVGFVAGPALGGLLGSYGPRWPFVAAAALTGANLVYGLIGMPESLPQARRRRFDWRQANPVSSLHVIAADPVFTRLALAWCAGWFALGALQSSFVLANDLRLGWGAQENGMALGFVGLGSALVQGLLVRRVIPRLGERVAALTGYVLAGCAYLLFAAAVQPWLLYAGIALQALSAVSGPAVQSLVSATAGPDRQGQVQGALASAQGLTAIVAPLVAGWAFSLAPAAPFALAALAYVLAFTAVWPVRPAARVP